MPSAQIIRSLNRDTFGASHMRRLSRVNLSAMQNMHLILTTNDKSVEKHITGFCNMQAFFFIQRTFVFL